MARSSKEMDILELFFNESSKQWHFKDIKKIVNISDSKITRWLDKFVADKIVLKIKEKGKFPYYIANHAKPEYINAKRMYALDKLNNTGLLNYLLSLRNDLFITIFGSFNRGDWYSESDIDIFIYGKTNDLNLSKYEKKLKRNGHFIPLLRVDVEKIKSNINIAKKKSLNLMMLVTCGGLNFLDIGECYIQSKAIK